MKKDNKVKKENKTQKKPSQKNDKNHSTKNTGKKKRILKISLLVFLLLVLIGGGSLAGMVISYANEAPEFDPQQLRPAETSFIYDREGNQIAPLHHEQERTIISLDEVPTHTQKAFIAIEDERFEDHFGVDIIGIIRAGMVNLMQREIVQGASTITQQLTRNAFLTAEQTFRRKIQEAWLAIQLERHYTKSEILEMYLNTIYFGNGAYGIEAASNTYFDKSADELTLAESAMLAGIPRSPNSNNPFFSEERALNRMKLVLYNMESVGYISSEEAEEARETENFEYGELREKELPYPYFLEYVLHRELVNTLKDMPEYGTRESAYEAIYTHGLKIHITMDTDIQAHVENTLDDDSMYPSTIRIDMDKFKEGYKEAGGNIPRDFPGAYIDEEKGVPQPQSAFVLADPTTGEIIALGGGRDFRKEENEILRYLSTRQPGSAIKPVVPYAAAFEENALAPGSIVYDVPFSAGSYSPKNWDGQYWGPINARDALRWSRNIPAVATLQDISPYKGTEYATNMGINSFTEDDRGSLTTALGGVSGIPPLQMAQAYGTLANMGVKAEFHTISHIKDRDGNVIYEQNNTPETVLSPQTAYMINHILEDAHRNTFTSNSRVAFDRPVAAKTGTTDERKDIYLAAYTPNIVSVIWIGNDIRDMGRIQGSYPFTTAITREIYNKVFEDLEVKYFSEQRPSGIIGMKVCSKTGLKPSDKCEKAGDVTTDMFTVQTAPNDTCKDHVEKEICKESELLAGEYCPDDAITKKVFFTGRYANYVGNEPPGSTCDVHDSETKEKDTDDDGDDTTQPPTATSFSAKWSSSQEEVQLEWNSPNTDNIKEYHLLREPSGGERLLLERLNRNRTHYKDKSNLEKGVTYNYILYVIDRDGNKSESVSSSVTIPGENGNEDDTGDDNDDNDNNDNNNEDNNDNSNGDNEEGGRFPSSISSSLNGVIMERYGIKIASIFLPLKNLLF